MPVVATSADDVFINCPFDDAFAPTFRALVFAITVRGFRPRSARERAKRILILDVEQYRYQRCISDLAWMNIHEHGGEPVRPCGR